MNLTKTIQLTIANRRTRVTDHQKEAARLSIEAEKSKLIADELQKLVNESDPVPDLRPAVATFAESMEAKLRENDEEKGPEGWKGVPISRLRELLHQELKEFQDVVDMLLDEECPEVDSVAVLKLVREGADVGNMIMMIVEEAKRNYGTKDDG